MIMIKIRINNYFIKIFIILNFTVNVRINN